MNRNIKPMQRSFLAALFLVIPPLTELSAIAQDTWPAQEATPLSLRSKTYRLSEDGRSWEEQAANQSLDTMSAPSSAPQFLDRSWATELDDSQSMRAFPSLDAPFRFNLPEAKDTFTAGGLLTLIGKPLWDLAQENQLPPAETWPVVHVLPSQASSPMELSNWTPRPSQVFRKVFEDFTGDDVAQLEYAINYDAGGKWEGKGSYLANISVVPRSIQVKTFYRLSARVRVLAPVNLGSERNPVAAVKVQVFTQVKDRILGGEKMETEELRIFTLVK